MEKTESEFDLNKLQTELKKLRLESKLRKQLATELTKQKTIAEDAKEEAIAKTTELAAISQKLAKYLPAQLYNSIFSGEQQVDLVSKRKKLTVFFSDIVDFTSISDTLESEEITAMLNYYLTEMSKIAVDFGGTIDKYVGDSIIVFFGDPDTDGVKKDAINCVNMAIAMQKRMRELKLYWAQTFSLKKPLQIRIGINTGFCTVGNFGSENRLDYTAVGGHVNLASRLESIGKPDSILISYDTYIQIKDEILCKESDTVQVKGIRENIRTFEIIMGESKDLHRLTFNSENLQCNLDIIKIETAEIEKLLSFIENNRQKLIP